MRPCRPLFGIVLRFFFFFWGGGGGGAGGALRYSTSMYFMALAAKNCRSRCVASLHGARTFGHLGCLGLLLLQLGVRGLSEDSRAAVSLIIILKK